MKQLLILSQIIITALFLLNSNHVFCQEVAITMDDPNCAATTYLTLEQIDQKILATLTKNHLKIALFVRGACIDSKNGKRLLQRWKKAQHILGNHTYSHLSITNVALADYIADTLKNEKLLAPYMRVNKLFRFPYLKEGDTKAKRDQFRQFLTKNHYQVGSVTIDASDWYISSRLEARLAHNPNIDITPYKKYYLRHIWNRAQYYDQLARAVLGRSPKHTLLIHHNLLNALFLDDLIQMFKSKGWQVINANEAFKDPIFKIQPSILPAGESLIWALARQAKRFDKQLRYPGEDESYEKEAMDKLGL